MLWIALLATRATPLFDDGRADVADDSTWEAFMRRNRFDGGRAGPLTRRTVRRLISWFESGKLLELDLEALAQAHDRGP